MSYSTCKTCQQRYWWRWQEAFDKFGFDDGDGQIETDRVVRVLENAGYRCETEGGLHNTIITSIKGVDGEELIPEGTAVGYGEPEAYLPSDIVGLLERALPEDGELVA